MRLKPKQYCVFLMLILFSSVSAKKITIQGVAPTFKSSTISFYKYADFVSLREKKIGSSLINEEGRFQISFDTDVVEYLILQIEDKRTNLYCKPGNVYNLIVSFDPKTNQNRIYDKKLSIKFSFPKANELNAQLTKFINQYVQFLVKNERLFIARKALPAIEEFSKKMESQYANVQDEYLKKYVRYNLAALKDGALSSRKKTYETYLKNHPIEYHNYEYMNLFRQFYKDQFEQMALGKDGLALLSSVNGTMDYQKLKSVVEKNTFLTNQDTLIELFIINGLQEVYPQKKLFKKEKVMNMLKHISKNGIHEQNRKTAHNVFTKLNWLSKGTRAPDFQLKDLANEAFTLSDFEGNFLYIQFWSSWSTPSIREMVLMDKLYAKYAKEVDFLSINMDEDPTVMEKLVSDKKYSWFFSHHSWDEDVKENYNVKSLPLYVLIDQKGNIIQYPAERPTGNIEKQFFNLIGK